MAKPSKDWVSLAIQFVPAILGSGVLISTINDYYTNIADDPNVTLTLFPDEENFSRVSVILSNNGGGPATNLTALITSPYNITDNETFSLEEIEVTMLDPRSIEIFMPRLIQGEGSIVNVSVSMSEADKYSENYKAFVVFDQGSDRGNIHAAVSVFDQLVSWAMTPIGIMVMGILITVVIIVTRRSLLRLRRLYLTKRYLDRVKEQSAVLDELFSEFKEGQPLLDSTANVLLSLERVGILNQELTNTFLQQFPNGQADMDVPEKHAKYFEAILNGQIRYFSSNKDRNDYFDALEKTIVTTVREHRSFDKLISGAVGSEELLTTRERHSDKALSNLIIRLHNFRQ